MGTLYKAPRLRLDKGVYWLNFEPYHTAGGSEAIKKEAGDKQNQHDFSTKMKSWVRFITTPSADTPGTALLLHFDRTRYLIGNMHEGLQRSCVQQGIGLSKVNHIFLTGAVNWGSIGGLLGMILTVADVVAQLKADPELKIKRDKGVYIDEPKLNLHGGKNLTHLLATARRFIFRKGMPVDVDEIRDWPRQDETQTRDWKPTYTDENIKVWAMNIRPEPLSQTSRKRSHDDMSDDSNMGSESVVPGGNVTREELEHQHNQIRRGVVSNMFDSDWRIDALKSMKLSEVKLPASIFIRNSEGKIEKYEGILPGGGGEYLPDIDVLVRTPWPGAMIASLPSTTPSTEFISYIIKNHPQRGKFNPKKAKELGVEEGPDFRRLIGGESVTTKDGKFVTPDMVLAPGKQGGGFAVVELPNKSYIDNLVKREEWSSKEAMDGVGAIIWILGKGVMEDSRLLEFRSKYNYLNHIVSAPDVCPDYISMWSSTEAAVKLNLIDPERFPVPVYNNTLPPDAHKVEMYSKARAGLTIQLEPHIEIQEEKIYKVFDRLAAAKNADPKMLQLANNARSTIDDPGYQVELEVAQKDIPSMDAEVITLGTGSALPSKYRNVSATLLRVPGYGNYLFDCGENTLGQMKRVFGAELPQILKDLKLIWISHLHADHHLGTAAVVKAWNDETARHATAQLDRLMIASDVGMLEWLKEYSEVENYGYSRLNCITMDGTKASQILFNKSDTTTYGLKSLQTVPVEHCHGALAVVLTCPNGFKVAYSGDCLPSKEFATIGQGATLLIHEATFDDELAGDALAKKHCTTSDALRVGQAMGAKRIVLTHFSQRYQKIPVMESKRGGEEQISIVAFDYMRVKLRDFAKVVHFRPALLKLYESDAK